MVKAHLAGRAFTGSACFLIRSACKTASPGTGLLFFVKRLQERKNALILLDTSQAKKKSTQL
jgi:hypothetical protein